MPVKTARSLKVLCPFCLDGESVTLELNDLGKITCGACSEEFTAQQAVAKANELAARWASIAAWIESAPVA